MERKNRNYSKNRIYHKDSKTMLHCSLATRIIKIMESSNKNKTKRSRSTPQDRLNQNADQKAARACVAPILSATRSTHKDLAKLLPKCKAKNRRVVKEKNRTKFQRSQRKTTQATKAVSLYLKKNKRMCQTMRSQSLNILFCQVKKRWKINLIKFIRTAINS